MSDGVECVGHGVVAGGIVDMGGKGDSEVESCR